MAPPANAHGHTAKMMTDGGADGFYPALSPALLAAPIEFQEWSQTQLLADQGRSAPTKPLYHYSGEEALKGILGNERLGYFSHLHQTDHTEFQFLLPLHAALSWKSAGARIRSRVISARA